MEEFKERLLSFVKDVLACSTREFERNCGLTNGTIGSIGSKGPGADVVQKIAYAYPDLDLNWLFRGDGEPIMSRIHDKTVQNDIHHCDTVNINYGALKDTIVEAIKEAKI